MTREATPARESGHYGESGKGPDPLDVERRSHSYLVDRAPGPNRRIHGCRDHILDREHRIGGNRTDLPGSGQESTLIADDTGHRELTCDHQ